MNLRVPNTPQPAATPQTGGARPAAPAGPLSPEQRIEQAFAVTAPPADASQTAQLGTGFATAPHSLSSGISHLRQSIEHGLRAKQPPLSPEQQTRLEDAVGDLDLLLRSRPEPATASERGALRQQLTRLAGELQNAGLLNANTRAALNEITSAAVSAMGKGANMPLQAASYGSHLAGLHGPSGNLTGTQLDVIRDSSAVMQMAHNIGIPPGPLTPEKMIALGLREQLVRLSSEMLLPPPASVKPGPSVYEDQILLLNGVEMLDKMLQGEKIPAGLLNDMTKLVDEARKSGGKGLKQVFDGLAQSGGQLAQAGTQINNASGNMQSLISAISSNSNAPNIVKPFNDIISGYASASTAATSSLPKLPFPIKMPVPINLGTPPNSLSVPAGSTLSYNPATKNYNLATTGMNLMTGGNQVITGPGNIQLGPTMDRIKVSSMNINSGGTNISSTGNTIQVNKLTNSSLIQAQNVNVNWADGAVSMDQVSIIQNPNQLQLAAQNLAYSDASTTASATGVQIGQTVQNGVTTTGFSGQNVNVLNNGTSLQAGQLGFNLFTDDNNGSSGVNFTGSDVHILSGKDKIDVGSGMLNITSQADGSSLTTLTATNGAWTNGTQTVTSSASAFQIQQGPGGQLSQISAFAKDLSYADGKQKVDVVNGALTANYDPSGQLSQINANAGQIDWAQGAQALNATGVAGQVNYGPNGQPTNLNAAAASINYTDGKSLLNATGGQLNMNYDSSGQLSDATVSGQSLNYANVGGNGKPLNVGLGAFTGTLKPNTQGGQDLSFNGDNLSVLADKTTANIPQIRNLNISTGADGAIDKFHVELPATNTVKTEDLNAALKNVQVDYQEKVLTATADQLSGTLTQPELKGTFELNGAKLIDTEQFTSLHLDSSSMDLSKLSEQYKLDIKNIDLVLDKNAVGQMTSGQLRFEDLQGKLKGYTISGTNEQGKQMVMSFGLSDDGKWLQKLGFEIPKGGQLSVNKDDDWFLKLGGDQKFGMNYDPTSKIYQFTAENLNAQYVNKDLTLDVSGLRGNRANLDVSLTPDKGLVINDISNLSGKITLKDAKGIAPVEIDIDKIKGFYLKQTGISGGSQGMMLHLAPTGPDSTMTASVRTAYNGIPLGISFKDVHELKVGGQIATNNARVYIGDPSGRGQIEIQAGPLKLKGSEIDIEAKYHMFDGQRMLNSLDKLNSDGNINVLGGVLGVDPIKGKVTLDTSNRRGPYLQANVLFPSPVAAAMREAQLPWMQNGIRDEGIGVTFGTGVRWRGESGDHQLGLDFGLLPGSYLELNQHKGSMTLGGVPMPSRMTLGTTPFAGINYKLKGEHSSLGIQAGAFANPAAFAPDSAKAFIYEDPQAKFGAYAGIKYQTDKGLFLGAEYIGTGNQPNQFFNAPSASDRTQGWNHQAKFSVGFTF